MLTLISAKGVTEKGATAKGATAKGATPMSLEQKDQTEIRMTESKQPVPKRLKIEGII